MLCLPKAVQPLAQERIQCRRDGWLRPACPTAHVALAYRLGQLLEEQRHAPAARDHPLDEFALQLGTANGSDKRAAVRRAEPLENDPCRVPMSTPALGKSASARGEDANRLLLQLDKGAKQQLFCRRIHPLHVLDDDQQGCALRHSPQHRQEQSDQSLAELLRRQFGDRGDIARSNLQHAANQRHFRLDIHAGTAQHLSHLVGLCLGAVLGRKLRGNRPVVDHRVERRGGVKRQALEMQHVGGIAADAIAELLRHPRLADPRLARHQHDLARSGPDPIPEARQQRHLSGASDQWRQLRGTIGLEARVERSRPGHLADAQWLRQALQPTLAQVAVLEYAACQAICRRGDDHAVGRGQVLDPRSDVRRLADHILRAVLVVRCADRDQAAGNADTDGERRPIARSVRRDRLDELETRANAAFGVILEGLRPAEVDQDAIAGIARDMPAKAAADTDADPAVAMHHGRELFRVESMRQRGRAHDVAEHHGKMPALRDPPRPAERRALFGEIGRRERRDRAHQALAVRRRNDQLLDIRFRQPRQIAKLDGLLGKARRIPAQSDSRQPDRQLSRHSATPSNGSIDLNLLGA